MIDPVVVERSRRGRPCFRWGRFGAGPSETSVVESEDSYFNVGGVKDGELVRGSCGPSPQRDGVGEAFRGDVQVALESVGTGWNEKSDVKGSRRPNGARSEGDH